MFEKRALSVFQLKLLVLKENICSLNNHFELKPITGNHR